MSCNPSTKLDRYRVEILEMRVHDLEPQIAERIALRETLEHHLPDPLRGNLGDAALPHRGLEIVDQPVGVLATERLRRRLANRARELAPVELLPAAIPLEDLDSGGFAALEGRETLLAAIARAAAPDRGRVLGLS